MGSVLRLAGLVAAFAFVSGYGSAPSDAASAKLHLRAALTNEAGQTVGTFYERCDGAAASSSVVLRKAMALKGGAILALYKAAEFNPVISTTVGPKGGNVRHFSGANSSGCVDKGTAVALTFSPGGPESTLLEVVGKGVVGDKRATANDTIPWPWPWYKPAQ